MTRLVVPFVSAGLGLLSALAFVALRADAPAVVATPRAPGAVEGIGVEGAWEIDVINRDGSVAEHRAFHNALTPDGITFLLQLLAPHNVSNAQVSGWEVLIVPDGGALEVNFNTGCLRAGPDCTAAAFSSSLGAGTFTLVADFPPGASRTIATVATIATFCSTAELSTTDRDGCQDDALNGARGTNRLFTTTSITPLPLTADQALRVRVTFRFGTLPSTP
jgi:hypothetical protein